MSHVDEGTLHAYLDGELPSSERAAVDAHLTQCATCRATLAEERALLERAGALLGAARPVERPAPPLEQLRRSPKRSPWRVRTSFAWAASVALALGLGYYLRGSARMLAPPQAVAVTEDRAVPAPAPSPANALPRQEPRVGTRRESPTIRQPESRADELARRDAPAGRGADSVAAIASPAAAEGAVALKSALEPARAQLRDSNLRLEGVVVTGASSAVAPSEGVGRTTQWQSISRGDARTLLGTDPVGLPGLATRRIRRSPAPDATVVVEQALDSSTVIQIFQRPADSPLYVVDGTPLRQTERDRAAARAAAPAAAPAPADRLARFVGRLRVEITGPLSPDSLNRLLEQVEPLP